MDNMAERVLLFMRLWTVNFASKSLLEISITASKHVGYITKFTRNPYI